ncbi:MAG: carboxypeptidase-like regulatory domain-containing protein, partial [Gammaproteobacteria bacterium]
MSRTLVVLVMGMVAFPVAATLTVSGKITDAQGMPIPFVRVTISGEATIPATTSVFSVANGRFSAASIDTTPNALVVDFFRIGWEEVERKVTVNGDSVEYALTLVPKSNVADQVPSSAWIPGEPGDRKYHILINECAGCHQLGAERVKRFARNLDDQPLAVKEATWDAMVQYMRATALRMGPAGHTELRWGLTEESPDYQYAISPPTSFFLPRDMEIVVPFLAEAFPTSFDTMTDYDDIARLGEYGVTKDTVIE